LPAAREGLNIFSHCGPLIDVICDWRKTAISLIVPQKGEQTAQACAMAWFQQLTPLGAAGTKL
jgi:hypothetical protein